MAFTSNPDIPDGFTVVGALGGDVARHLRVLGADGGGDIYKKDLIVMEADGYIAKGTATGDGVFLGLSDVTLRSTAPGEHPGWYDGSVVGASDNLLCAVGSGLLLEAQEDGASDPIDLADVGAGFAAIDTGGGNATTGWSQMEIDSSSHATTVTLPLRLHRLVNKPTNHLGTDNSSSAVNARWICILNATYLGSGNAAI